MVEALSGANGGPYVEHLGVGRKCEPELHQAPDRNWLGQVTAEPTLGDDAAAPIKVAFYVITNSQG